ncbi:hypothetical protein FSP39_024815 [Pinctada imbricata]|uniref:Heparan-sulfate 6-O-sulfotransferase n=1 Tax=Pinctada imbricata TaxID=66713 RepID=A0AA88Y1N2_PINIB|nr:hypothetical protein FSP39_024815 [Pinctada imbricata]
MNRKYLSKLICIALFVVGTILLLVLHCADSECAFWAKRNSPYKNVDELRQYLNGQLLPHHFDRKLLDKEYNLDLEKEDVIVFLHIQKTGGTSFGKHLVNNLDLDTPCECIKGRKRCDCLTKKKTLWLFSRYSTGWACGLHADWTELKSCVEDAMDKEENGHRDRRYHYITILRDPVNRYLSEWKHVKRGATWRTARLYCNGRQATLEEVPFCYEGEDWEGVTLNQFLRCKYNLGNNRQTRMLANLSKVNCYNNTGMSDEERDSLLLESAKENLKNLSYFGLTEYQRETQQLFEHTFHIHFVEDFVQLNETHSQRANPTKEQWDKIIKVNSLDIKLYQFAKDLFLQRVETMKKALNDESLFPSDGNDVEQN